MESNGISIVPINPGCGYDGPAKIAANVFCNYFRIAKIGFGIDIEAMFVLTVTFRFYFFKFLKEGPILSSSSLRRAVRNALRR